MERFNYPNLSAVYAESAQILKLLEAESYGSKADDHEELERQRFEMERRVENG